MKQQLSFPWYVCVKLGRVRERKRERRRVSEGWNERKNKRRFFINPLEEREEALRKRSWQMRMMKAQMKVWWVSMERLVKMRRGQQERRDGRSGEGFQWLCSCCVSQSRRGDPKAVAPSDWHVKVTMHNIHSPPLPPSQPPWMPSASAASYL